MTDTEIAVEREVTTHGLVYASAMRERQWLTGAFNRVVASVREEARLVAGTLADQLGRQSGYLWTNSQVTRLVIAIAHSIEGKPDDLKTTLAEIYREQRQSTTSSTSPQRANPSVVRGPVSTVTGS